MLGQSSDASAQNSEVSAPRTLSISKTTFERNARRMDAFKNMHTFNREAVSDAGSLVLLVHPKLLVGVGHLVSC